MKKNIIFLAGLCFFFLPSFSQEEHWEVYLAQYEKGAGSTLINMSLRESAPIKQYPFLLKAGVKANNCPKDGLPSGKELDLLYKISDRIKDVLDSIVLNKPAGTFSYQCTRTDYYYMKDTNRVQKVLASFLKAKFPKYEATVEIKSDTGWETYLNFLYPNEVSVEYIENEKVIANLTKSGDNLSKPRLVDHWLYFKTEADRSAFLRYAQQENFKLEKKDFSKKSELPFQLHISRTDKVDINSISVITLRLKKKAKELNGDYDGWETFVVK